MIVVVCTLLTGGFLSAQNDCTNIFDENAQNCCENCTCRYCYQVGCCQDNPNYSEGDCGWQGDVGGCGIPLESSLGAGDGGVALCSSFSQSNNNGGVCIPIDGELGFLILGGGAFGLLGLRRRRQFELLSAA